MADRSVSTNAADAATRTEKDPLGALAVPASALYGVQTLRATQNFPISGMRPLPMFVTAVVWIKKAAALTHKETGRLDAALADAIVAAADEILSGAHREHFIVDVFQAGAGTSHNMNVNEVLANLANEHLGSARGSYAPIHPNDHVNMAQSTNDMIPTNIRLGALALARDLAATFGDLRDALLAKGAEFDDVVKSGRTHLQDAMPIRLGQEFRAYGVTIDRSLKRIENGRGLSPRPRHRRQRSGHGRQRREGISRAHGEAPREITGSICAKEQIAFS